MGLVKEWSSLICLASMAGVIFELILPPGKMEKMIRMVLGIFMVCIIIFPFSERKNSWDFKIKKITSGYVDKERVKFVEKINGQIEYLAKENVRRVIVGFLKDEGIEYEKIEIFMDTDKHKNISIIKCKIYLNKDDDGLKEKVKSDVENKFGIETEVIV